MNPSRRLTFALLTLAVCVTVLVDDVSGFLVDDVQGCWEVWSRCSGWSSSLTGVLWATCPDRCVELGHHNGTCVERPAPECPLSETAFRCSCFD